MHHTCWLKSQLKSAPSHRTDTSPVHMTCGTVAGLKPSTRSAMYFSVSFFWWRRSAKRLIGMFVNDRSALKAMPYRSCSSFL